MDQQNQNQPATPGVEPVAPQVPDNVIPQAPIPPQPAAPIAPEPTPVPQVMPSPETASGTYVQNVGQSMVDLLTDISLSDQRKQKMASEMNLPIEQIESLCTGLLDKIDNLQLTEEELAFLITAPVTDQDAAS